MNRVTSPFLMLALVGSLAASCGSDSSDTAAGVSANVRCAEGSESCRCASEGFTLSGDERNVDDCDASPGWQCCHDLDTDGLTSACECQSYVCTGTDTSCECHWRPDDPGPSRIAPAECTNARAGTVAFPIPGLCCDDGQSCNCYAASSSTAVASCARGVEKTSCAGTGTSRSCEWFGTNNLHGHGPRSSCANLEWK
jgi:hypothetical protein